MSIVPSDAEQLAFLASFQKILDEGQLAATYKFALLVALVEIAIERGDDTGARLKIRLDQLAEKFIELYWGHAREFCGTVLSQNNGANIAVLNHVAELQRQTPVLADVRRLPQWRTKVGFIRNIIRAMPLLRLQLLRNGQRIPFLYEEVVVDGAIRLKTGVAYCLRKFSTLLGSLARNAWLREIRDNPRNAYAIGQTQSLEAFLFGDDRIPLGRVRDVLVPLQQGRCFYCGGMLGDAMHVDHFVPWALYPSNLGHNFVLADARCNADKSSLLADVAHLDRWHARNESAGEQLVPLGLRARPGDDRRHLGSERLHATDARRRPPVRLVTPRRPRIRVAARRPTPRSAPGRARRVRDSRRIPRARRRRGSRRCHNGDCRNSSRARRDTWCHLRNDLRSFSVDGIRRIEIVDAPAKEVSLKALDEYLLESYGIVRGGEAQRARLRFSAERARWVAAEIWHPDQKGSFDGEGRYLLELPFRDDRELVLDILRHGAEVEVLSPAALRRKVCAEHAAAARLNG